jgi:phage baseplate assembly protein W
MATSSRQQLFGTDIKLLSQLSGFDLGVGGSGDVAIARGNDNIEQALLLRLMVRRGELAPLGWPDYGSRIHELVGEPNNQRTRLIVMAYARAAIAQDPRVVDIPRIEARDGGERDVVRLDLDVTLIDQQTPLNLVFDVNLGSV